MSAWLNKALLPLTDDRFLFGSRVFDFQQLVKEVQADVARFDILENSSADMQCHQLLVHELIVDGQADFAGVLVDHFRRGS